MLLLLELLANLMLCANDKSTLLVYTNSHRAKLIRSSSVYPILPQSSQWKALQPSGARHVTVIMLICLPTLILYFISITPSVRRHIGVTPSSASSTTILSHHLPVVLSSRMPHTLHTSRIQFMCAEYRLQCHFLAVFFLPPCSFYLSFGATCLWAHQRCKSRYCTESVWHEYWTVWIIRDRNIGAYCCRRFAIRTQYLLVSIRLSCFCLLDWKCTCTVSYASAIDSQVSTNI